MENLIYASYGGSQKGVTIRDFDLNQQSFINMGFDINDVAVAPEGDFYVAAANNIYHYKRDGSLINTMTWPSTSINYTSIAVRGDRVIAAYDGSQQGFTVRDLSLNQISFFNTGFQINGLAAGMNNDLYLACPDNLYHYRTDGTLVNHINWPTIDYTSISVFCDKVYASYKGSQQGFTVRDLNLQQIFAFNTGFDINGICSGQNNDLFLTSGNHIYNYRTDGTVITNMTFPIASIVYGGVSAVFTSLT